MPCSMWAAYRLPLGTCKPPDPGRFNATFDASVSSSSLQGSKWDMDTQGYLKRQHAPSRTPEGVLKLAFVVVGDNKFDPYMQRPFTCDISGGQLERRVAGPIIPDRDSLLGRPTNRPPCEETFKWIFRLPVPAISTLNARTLRRYRVNPLRCITTLSSPTSERIELVIAWFKVIIQIGRWA